MRSADVAKGGTYAYIMWGSRAGRHKPSLGHDSLVKVTALAEPQHGEVRVKTHEGRGNASRERVVPVGHLVGTWEAHTSAAAQQKKWKDDAIAHHRADDARLRELLGPKVYSEHRHSIGFKVYGDGSYSSSIHSMQRGTLVALLEAAYENGKAAS